MSNDAEMAEYRVKRTFRGQPCEVYFFGTWTGYSHPVQPRKPLRFREALLLPAFYKAYMSPAKFGPAFVFFKKQMYERAPIELRVPLHANGVAERFFTFIREGDSIVAGREIEAQDAVDSDEYLHAGFPPGVDAVRNVELVRVDDGYSYEYFYNDEGVLLKAVLESERRMTVLEPGQEPKEFIKHK